MTREFWMGQAYSENKFGGELVRLGAGVGAARGGPMTRKTKILLAAGILTLVCVGGGGRHLHPNR